MSAPARTQLEALGLSSACVEVLRHLWDYLDDQISPDSGARLRAHIAACPQCHDYELYQGCFLQSLAKLRAELAAPGPWRARLAASLKQQGCGCWDKVK